MTASLCCCEKEIFIENYWSPVMELLLQARCLNKLRNISLELIQKLMEIALNTNINVIDEKLQMLFSQLFPPKKICLNPPINDCIDSFVNLITMVSKYKLDFVFKNIIFELIKGEILTEYSIFIYFYLNIFF